MRDRSWRKLNAADGYADSASAVEDADGGGFARNTPRTRYVPYGKMTSVSPATYRNNAAWRSARNASNRPSSRTRRVLSRHAMHGRSLRRGSTVFGVSIGSARRIALRPSTRTATGYAFLPRTFLLTPHGVLEHRSPLVFRERLEALGSLDAQRHLGGHLAILAEEASRPLHCLRAAREMKPERARAGPIAHAVHQAIGDGVGKQVHRACRSGPRARRDRRRSVVLRPRSSPHRPRNAFIAFATIL